MKTIVFEKARLVGYKGRVRGSSHSLVIEASARLTATVASALECRWVLFDKAELPKGGYRKIELDTELKNVSFEYVIPNLDQYKLLLSPESVDKFIVTKQGDGKKKAAGLFLRFHINYTGNAHDLIDTFERLGSSDGIMTIAERQADMFAEEKPTAAKANGKGKRAKQAEIVEQQPDLSGMRGQVLSIIDASRAKNAKPAETPESVQ